MDALDITIVFAVVGIMLAIAVEVYIWKRKR